ncbi:MAG TPA: cytochrome c [Vicinamibacteria bacterium]|nr:cytochrome c [Vicinamibacteria bacterium]
MRPKALGKTALVLLAAAVTACRQDMHDQPKYKPFRESEMFADRRSARPLVPGTVARGTLREDAVLYTGKLGKDFVTEIPVKVTAVLLERGQTEFQVFCSPCHGRTGRGDGMVVQRGFKKPSSYHVDRLRQMPIGYFYDVITNGYGAMSDYSAQVAPLDRWAIAAYVRTLQYSQHAPSSDVPVEKRPELDRSLAAGPPPASEHHP